MAGTTPVVTPSGASATGATAAAGAFIASHSASSDMSEGACSIIIGAAATETVSGNGSLSTCAMAGTSTTGAEVPGAPTTSRIALGKRTIAVTPLPPGVVVNITLISWRAARRATTWKPSILLLSRSNDDTWFSRRLASASSSAVMPNP